MSSILITGATGFIGYHLQNYLTPFHSIQAMDIFTNADYRPIRDRNIVQASILDNFIDNLAVKPEVVVHLAAETGISGSLKNPEKYFKTNVEGTFHMLEQCRKNGVKYLIYASSSSVYSSNQSIMKEDSDTSMQLSFYGTSKKMTELMIENYCKQFGMIAIGLRFFTVYGSWTRTDMAAYKFMNAIKLGQSITLYNNGEVERDFTHVSDIVKSIKLLIDKIQFELSGTHKIFNIGYGKPITVKKYAQLIAGNLQLPLNFESEKLPKNELPYTFADTTQLNQYIGYKPMCSVEEGIKEMTDWFKNANYD